MIGAAVTLEQLQRDPHPLLARLREHAPVSWIGALDGWLVTRHDLVLEAMRDWETFTVNDPRFSTARVVGPSMLSLDGPEHELHRAPFAAPFRARAVGERFAQPIAEEANELIDRLEPAGGGELRRSFAGPLAAAVIVRALGLEGEGVPSVLGWYDAIVGAVTEITAGAGDGFAGRTAFDQLRARVQAAIEASDHDSLLAAAARESALGDDRIASNAAILLFGGIETTEGMIANAILHLLERPGLVVRVRQEPGLLDAAIEESLRLEPAAAVVDRYATRDTELGGATIARRDLVRLSISAANRDPAVFEHPNRFDLERVNARRHLAFAQGPHVCVGVHLARLEARIGIGWLLRRLPRLRLDPGRPSAARGLVFRKPPRLDALWD